MSEDFVYPPIFLSSADAYSDMWPLFFSLFQKYWPEYNGVIYLNTQKKTIDIEGLNIVCTKLGRLGSFGKEMRACLDRIDSDTVILMLIDFIFMGKVNDEKFREYFLFFKENQLDTLNFIYYESSNQTDSSNPDIVMVAPPAPKVFFNYQIAFWKKSVLFEMVLPHENPWSSEWFGTKRAEKMKIKTGLIKEIPGSPINYHQSGCLAKSKWHPVAVSFLKKEGIEVDFDKRGFADLKTPITFKLRYKIKKMLVIDGFKGSYKDLIFRKAIH